MRHRVVRKGLADLAASVVFLATLWFFLPPALGAAHSGAVAPPEAFPQADASVWDRVLDEASIGMVRLLLVAGGAFVLAAISQRLVLGAFEFEALGFKLPAERATMVSFQDFRTIVDRQRSELSSRVAHVADTTGRQVRDLTERVSMLESLVEDRG